MAPRGVTLVELLIIVMIVSILALLILPAINSERREAAASALAANVSTVTMVLEHRRQQTPDGSWPPSIDAQWFASGKMPGHPDQMAGVPLVEVVAADSLAHPRDKLVHPGSPGAYWYNRDNGVFRARVKQQPTAGETLALYNTVNQCSLPGLADLGEAVLPVGALR